MKITLTFAVLFGLVAVYAQPQSTALLTLERTIALPDGTGKFDHFAIDLQANRLFIAATGNHTIEVVDLNTSQVIQTITGLGKPHGLVWVAATGRLYVSDGSQGDLKIYQGWPLKQTQSIQLSEDADDMVYDAKRSLLYVGHGGGDGANPARIAVIDTKHQTLVQELPMSTHPEGLDIDNVRDRVFVNVAGSNEVAAVDGATHSVSALWTITRAQDNVPVAFDEQHNLLFVACRKPGRLVVLDGNEGRELADLPADNGGDDIFYDAGTHRVYLVAGGGAVDLYAVDSDRAVRPIGVTQTAAGAKTGLLVPSQHALYVGVVSAGGKEAEIRVYATN